MALNDILNNVSNIQNSKKRNLAGYREDLETLQVLVDSLRDNPPSFDQFKIFLKDVHDILVIADTNLRSNILRAIRMSISHNPMLLQLFLNDNDILWMVVTSFERDPQYLIERIQGHKLMKVSLELLPSRFPLCFARSLHAVASQRDDPLRKISLEALRLLCLANPLLFASANCSSLLFEAILDPEISDMAESLLLSILQTCSFEDSRQALCARFQLRTLLSPLTDLDFEHAEDKRRYWTSSKLALITLMRSWSGVVLLTSDELGLPVLSKVLQDTKVSIICL
jgi:rapamycin-insensitive companion of mTOR